MLEPAANDAFDEIVASLDYPLFIVSAATVDDVAACLIGFATQCSIEPPHFQVCLSKNNRTCEVARGAASLVVHRVRRDQVALAEHFGGISAKDDPDKLANWPWRAGPGGAPVIDDCDWFAGECRRHEQLGYQDASGIAAGQPVG